MFDAINMAKMAQDEMGDKEAGVEVKTDKTSKCFRNTLCKRFLKAINLTTMNTNSCFIFSEENLIRKYARMAIEWGYPFKIKILMFF